MTIKIPRTYAFIDASNLFYGGEKSLGWKIDYQKLFDYLRTKYNVKKTLYFGGGNFRDFEYLKYLLKMEKKI
jgi:hypothetical protein